MNNKFPVIQTTRFLMRQFIAADLENVFKGLSHPDVIKYYGVSYSTLEEANIQMRFFADIQKNETGTWWAICSADNKIFYGGCGLNNINKQHKKGEVGYWLLPEFWGMGIITETVPLACEHGFKSFGLHRIEAVVESKNTNSAKVMVRLGFSFEGTMKECEIKNGRYIDLDMYAKLNPHQGQ